MTWEQTKREYRDDHPWCQIWPILTDPIREVVIGYSHARNIDGHEIAHICRGSGRRDVVENILHAHANVHRWCDSTGLAGKVILIAAKMHSGEDHRELWAELMGVDSIEGWASTDECVRQCMRKGVDHLRREIAEGGATRSH